MTVLPELIPLSIEMSKRGLTGVMNYTNPGAISHNEILELYKQYIDPDFSWCAPPAVLVASEPGACPELGFCALLFVPQPCLD